MEQLAGIRTFREVAELGSFTSAADRLGMSTPMVSKHVARLERDLGARLFNRSSRHVSLTEAGQLYYEQCRQALDLLEAARALIGSASTAPRGELKVSAPVWCATDRFAHLLAGYQTRYPDVRIDMHLENRMVDLALEGFDVGIRVTSRPSPSLIAKPICPIRFTLVASRDYVARHREQPGPLSLVMPNYVNIERLGHDGIAQLRLGQARTVLKSSDTNLSYLLVRKGMGAAFLPNWLVDADVKAGELVALGGVNGEFEGTLYAIYTSRRHLPPKVRSFIDFLNEELAPDRAESGEK